MTDAELVLMRAIWEQQDAYARGDAWANARAIIKQKGRERLMADAQSRLAAWINNYLAAAAIEYGNFLINPGSGLDASSVRRAAIPPLMDAAAATITSDVIDPEEQTLLLEPLAAIRGSGGLMVTTSQPGEAMIIGVVGAGTMGAGIAQVCLQTGHEVQLYDVDHAAIERGRERIADGLGKLVEKDRLTPHERQQMLDSLHDSHSLEGLAQEADFVIEAALEDLDLKRTVFRALGASAPASTILATNTSALSVTEIAEASGVSERVLGLHFFNPAPLMPLVEVVATRRTSQSVLDRAVSFVEGLGKEAILSADSPGFIVNRVNRPFTLEALRMLEAGEAGVEQIDREVESAGYPMGPFALMDLVGIDVNLAVASALWTGFDEAVRFQPSRIQRDLVESGQLGRKTGAGFYRYQTGRPVSLATRFGGAQDAATAFDADQILRRIELAVINEAYLAAGEGVADPADIDRAMKLGANHPYGPFERAGQLGLRAVVEGLRDLERRYGERFRVAPALWQVASL